MKSPIPSNYCHIGVFTSMLTYIVKAIFYNFPPPPRPFGKNSSVSFSIRFVSSTIPSTISYKQPHRHYTVHSPKTAMANSHHSHGHHTVSHHSYLTRIRLGPPPRLMCSERSKKGINRMKNGGELQRQIADGGRLDMSII